MTTLYDFLTVALFGVLVGYFVFLTDRRPVWVKHFLVSAVAFAVANQLGNTGSNLLASFLIVAGIIYAVLVIRTKSWTA